MKNKLSLTIFFVLVMSISSFSFLDSKTETGLTLDKLIKTAEADYENIFFNLSTDEDGEGDMSIDHEIYLCESDVEDAYEDYQNSGTTDDYLVYVLEGC